MFSRMSVGHKLFVGFALVIFVTFGLGVLAIQRMSAMNAATQVMTVNYFPSIVLGDEMRSGPQRIRPRDVWLIVPGQSSEKQSTEKPITDLIAAYVRARASYNDLINPGEEAELYKRIDALWARYPAARVPMVAAARFNDEKTATDLWKGDVRDAFWPLWALFNQHVEYSRAQGVASSHRENILSVRF